MKHNWILYNKNNRFGFLPILKNGNMFFRNHFTGNGWVKADVVELGSNFTNVKVSDVNIKEYVCAVRHPKDRLISALVEILNVRHPQILGLFNKLDFKNNGDINTGLFILKAYHDDHIYPISYLYSEIFYKIKGIPMDHPKKNTNQLIVEYFKERDVMMILPKDAKSHVSGENIKKTRNKFKELLNTPPAKKLYEDYIAPFYSKDLELYNKAHARIPK